MIVLHLGLEQRAEQARMQRLERVELGRTLAMPFLEVALAGVTFLDRCARQFQIDALFLRQRERDDLDVEVQTSLGEDELDLATDREGHVLALRIKIANVEDPASAAAVPNALDQIEAGLDADLADKRAIIPAVAAAERQADVFDVGFLDPDLAVIELRHLCAPGRLLQDQARQAWEVRRRDGRRSELRVEDRVVDLDGRQLGLAAADQMQVRRRIAPILDQVGIDEVEVARPLAGFLERRPAIDGVLIDTTADDGDRRGG